MSRSRLPSTAFGSALAHNFQELVIGSDAFVNGHVLRHVQLLLPHILIERAHSSSFFIRRVIRHLELHLDQPVAAKRSRLFHYSASVVGD